jgi:soluble lytic murein transglycosylase
MKFLLFALLFILVPALVQAAEGVLSNSGVSRVGTASSLNKPASGSSMAHAPKANTGDPDEAGADDEDFLAARDAFRAGNASRFERYAAHLKNSVLEPYLAYYRLRMHLQTSDAPTVQKFLARPDDTPVIDRLRGEWLKQLGENRQWDAFMAEYPHLLNEDTELACYALQARRNLQEDGVLREARNLWRASGMDLPESCTPLFEAALGKGIISEEDIWVRIRLALEGGNVSLAKSLSKKLPLKHAPSPRDLSAAAANPAHYLAKAKLNNADEAQRTVALFALQRLAKQLPQLAYARWGKIAANFPDAEQHYFYAWLGYEAARQLDARALEWFTAAGNAPLTEQQLAWRTRAALRVQNWQEILTSVNRMAPQQQHEDAWRYWKGRALKALGRTDEANELFSSLSGEYNFYGQLAAEELGNRPASGIMSFAYQPSEEELKAMLAQPAIQRTLALYRMGLRTDAAKEWAWAVRDFNDRQLLIAAEVARRNEMYDRAINTADRTVQLHDFNLRYLAPYREALQPHILQNGLEEAWVYGLMRQESRFVSHAKSDVGAAGLMQVMPATARWIARKLGIKNYRKSLIHKVDTNLRLGTYYMKTMLSSFDDSPVLASAAYNAGPTRARQWRGDIPLEGAIYIETIPFDETRNYVKKVMSNTVYYAALFGQPPRSLKERLGVVAARGSANQLPVPDER